MNTARRAAALAPLAAVLSIAGTARAHDIWLTEHGQGAQSVVDVAYGDLDGRELADPDRIVALEVIGAGPRTDIRGDLPAGQRGGHPVRTSKAFRPEPGSVVAVTYDNGFWLTLPGDSSETNTNKVLAPAGTNPHGTVKYGKLLLGRGASGKVVGARLELVLLQDPYAAAPGANLPVRLQLEGKPVAGASIAYSDGIEPIPDARQPTAKTNGDGVAEIPLRGRGPLLLTVDINAPPSHPALADQDHLYASLSVDTSR
jgi:uncharacterized GH25 family protein